MLKTLAFILLLGFTFPTLNVFSQNFSLGIVGGATSSQISGDGIHGFAQFGAIAGADVNYRFNENWSGSLALQFNQKGARNYQSESVYSAYRLRVNYVEVPVILNYHLNKLQFQAGLYLGAKVNQKERNSFGLVDPVREFKPFDFGGQLGISYAFKENWQVELRFQNSIAPVRDHDLNQVYPPNWLVIGDWHQKILDLGQYYTSLSLVVRREF